MSLETQFLECCLKLRNKNYLFSPCFDNTPSRRIVENGVRDCFNIRRRVRRVRRSAHESRRAATRRRVFRARMSALELALSRELNQRGVFPTAPWLTACVRTLSASVTRFSSMPLETQGELVFAQFLASDMNVCGDGGFPQLLHPAPQKQEFRTRILLQVCNGCFT